MEETPTDWRPGPRPDWVQALHTIADPAWIRLDADELLAEASAKSGLSDFGDDDFLEPYRVFVRALDEASSRDLRASSRAAICSWRQPWRAASVRVHAD